MLINYQPPERWKAYAFAGHWLCHQQSSQQIVLLNDTGRFIFQQIEQGNSSDEIAENLQNKFQLSHATAFRDIQNCRLQWQAFNHETHSTTEANRSRVNTPSAMLKTSALNPQQAVTFSLKIAGRQFQIQLQDQWLEQALLEIIGHLVCEPITKDILKLTVQQDGSYYQISINGQVTHELFRKDEVIARIIYELVEACYQRPEKPAVLHAAALATDTAALIFAGTQGSGKSTLVAALQNHGFDYLADDVCPLINGELVPVPMSQVLKSGSWEPLSKCRPELQYKSIYQRLGQSVKYLPPKNTDANSWAKNWPVTALIFPCYKAETTPTCQLIDPIQALQKLIQSGALFMEKIPQVLSWLETTPAYSLHYTNTEQAVSAVTQISTATNMKRGETSMYQQQSQTHTGNRQR